MLPTLSAAQLALYNRFLVQYRPLGSTAWQSHSTSSQSRQFVVPEPLSDGPYEYKITAAGPGGMLTNVPLVFTLRFLG